MPPRKLLVAVDPDAPLAPPSPALTLAASLAAPDDALHLVTVLPPPLLSGGIPPFAATAAALSTFETQLAAAKERARAALAAARDAAVGGLGVDEARVKVHVLPSTGGASGASASLAAWAHSRHADLVVVGARSMGGAARALAPLVGLGSVSDALIKHAHAPAVAVARGSGRPPADAPPVVVVAVDDSAPARAALKWAATTLARQGEAAIQGATLHVVSVAQLPPFPIVVGADPSMVANALAADAWDAGKTECVRTAQRVATDGAAAAACLVPACVTVVSHALTPREGSAAAADEVAAYAKAKGATLLVCGSRGLGAVKRALLSIVGLGSVSAALAHAAPCAVVVVRGGEDEDGGHAHAG